MGCAVGTCTDPDCELCVRLKLRFPPIVRCARELDGKRCRFVQGHPPPCKPDHERKNEENALRDGDPKLAGERKRDPIFTKRQRAGPNWVPRDKRV